MRGVARRWRQRRSKRSTSQQQYPHDSSIEESQTSSFPNSPFLLHCWVYHLVCEHVVNEGCSIVPFTSSRPTQDIQGVRRHGEGGNDHQPWRLANRVDQWCGEPNQRAIVGNANGGRKEGVWGQCSARGGVACWWRGWKCVKWCGEYSIGLLFKVLSLSTMNCSITQHCTVNDKSGSFVGLSLVNGILVTCWGVQAEGWKNWRAQTVLCFQVKSTLLELLPIRYFVHFW